MISKNFYDDIIIRYFFQSMRSRWLTESDKILVSVVNLRLLFVKLVPLQLLFFLKSQVYF